MRAGMDEAYAEARRVIRLCGICNYCAGLCAVFRSGQRQSSLAEGNLEHLAHLCHNCRACWYACQYAPPHEFAVNVPATLARIRTESYARHAWPGVFAGIFPRRPALIMGAGLATGVLVSLLALLLLPFERLFGAHQGAGAFYRIIPWEFLSGIAAITFAHAVIATAIGIKRYQYKAPLPGRGAASRHQSWGEAVRGALSLRNLDGGGAGCNDVDGRLTQWRRMAHHALFYGFFLCLAATLVGGFYHHALGRIAPYPLFSLPSLLGTIGGIGMVLGSSGMLAINWRADRGPTSPQARASGNALLILLLAVSLSGLLLQSLRGTPAMGLLLAFHFGTVVGLFLVIPYSKMVHGAYRLVALGRAAEEKQLDANGRPMFSKS